MNDSQHTPLDLEVHQYADFPELIRKTSAVTVIGYVDMHVVGAPLHGLAIMIGDGEPTPESEAEKLRVAHIFKAAPRLLEALEHLNNRLETISEAHPEIHLKDAVALAYGAIWEAKNEKLTWRDAIKISRARGEWTQEMDESWGDDVNHGETKIP